MATTETSGGSLVKSVTATEDSGNPGEYLAASETIVLDELRSWTLVVLTNSGGTISIEDGDDIALPELIAQVGELVLGPGVAKIVLTAPANGSSQFSAKIAVIPRSDSRT